MDFCEIINEDLIKIGIEASTRQKAIEELLDLFVQTHEVRIVHRQEILDEIMKREKACSTGVGDGIAVPHTKTKHVSDIIAAMGISSNGVNFEAVDGAPVNIIILILIPDENYSRYLKTLAGIAKLSKSETFRSSLAGAAGPEEAMSVIELECDLIKK